jgi:hypothetical protein
MHSHLRQAYGREVDNRMVLLASNLPGTGRPSLRVVALAKEQGIDLSDYTKTLDQDKYLTDRQKLAVLTEELLAHLEEGRVETGLKLKTITGKLRIYLEGVIGAIRQFLRKHGFAEFAELGVTDLRHLMREARLHGDAIEAGQGVPVFNRGDSVWRSGLRAAVDSVKQAKATAEPTLSCTKPLSPAAAPARSGRTDSAEAVALGMVSPLPMPLSISGTNNSAGAHVVTNGISEAKPTATMDIAMPSGIIRAAPKRWLNRPVRKLPIM